MLANSFSYMPVFIDEGGKKEWKLVSDHEIAKYLRMALSTNNKKIRLATTLEEAIKTGGIKLHTTRCLSCDSPVTEALEKFDGLPILICSGEQSNLIGILTSFDLL
jgi:hypothetical protein